MPPSRPPHRPFLSAPFQNVTEKQKACETDLAKAEPALLAAQEALDTLNKVGGAGPAGGAGRAAAVVSISSAMPAVCRTT